MYPGPHPSGTTTRINWVSGALLLPGFQTLTTSARPFRFFFRCSSKSARNLASFSIRAIRFASRSGATRTLTPSLHVLLVGRLPASCDTTWPSFNAMSLSLLVTSHLFVKGLWRVSVRGEGRRGRMNRRASERGCSVPSVFLVAKPTHGAGRCEQERRSQGGHGWMDDGGGAAISRT